MGQLLMEAGRVTPHSTIKDDVGVELEVGEDVGLMVGEHVGSIRNR